MERPFTRRERRQLVDVCGWLHEGAKFDPDGVELPDGTNPVALINEWRSWVEECLVLMDGDGRFRHLPYAGTYREQPEFDMSVLQVIRSEFNRLTNEQMRRKTEAART